jgi:DNA-binding response OmpR family regulator
VTDITYKTLVVEDDPVIAKTLQMSLPYEGFSVTICPTCKQGRAAMKTGTFDIALLDVNLPDGSGLELCKEIRSAQIEMPVLILTAKLDEETALKGFEWGADDHMRKPYSVKELVARMRRLVERRQKNNQSAQFAGIKVDMAKHEVWIASKQVHLGKREFDILTLLVKRSGEAVTRNEILNALGEDADVFDRTIDSHLSHLRRKLKDSGLENVQISAIYGVGYKLEKK